MARVLVLGYGNLGRLDDGLGPRLADEIAGRGLPDVTVDADYQLMIEDAAVIAEHDVVVFADADTAAPDPFEFRRIEPRRAAAFTSHSVAPDALLGLAREHFGCATVGYVLGIRGHEFNEFGERLSARAEANLSEAVEFLVRVLAEASFEEAAAANAAGRGR